MIDESNPVNVEDTQDVGDMREMQSRGVADEGVHIPSIIEEMEMEDQELEEAVADEDSSDEEGNAPVPAECRNQEFLKLVVSEVDRTPWEYHENEVLRVLCILQRSLLLMQLNSDRCLFGGSSKL